MWLEHMQGALHRHFLIMAIGQIQAKGATIRGVEIVVGNGARVSLGFKLENAAD
jgi:hypothetical protein